MADVPVADPRVLLDTQRLADGLLALGQCESEDAVFVLGDGGLVVHVVCQRELARRAAIVDLATHGARAVATFLFFFTLDFGADRHAVSIDVDQDVLLLDAWYLRLDLVLLVGLRQIDLDRARDRWRTGIV